MKFKTIIFLGSLFFFLCSYSVNALEAENEEMSPTIPGRIIKAPHDYYHLEEESGSIASSARRYECPSVNACVYFGAFCGGCLLLILYLTGQVRGT